MTSRYEIRSERGLFCNMKPQLLKPTLGARIQGHYYKLNEQHFLVYAICEHEQQVKQDQRQVYSQDTPRVCLHGFNQSAK